MVIGNEKQIPLNLNGGTHMALFSVEPMKCKRDLVCVEECPGMLIVFNKDQILPMPIEDAEEFCINCGHCVAVCPHGALSLKTMPTNECKPMEKDWALTPRQVSNLLKSRRSIRTYREKPVERATIEALIDVARYAPSGHNSQPVHWLVINDAQEIQRLAGLVSGWLGYMIKEQPALAGELNMDRVLKAWEAGKDRICRNAPVLIVAHAEKDDRTAPQACTIALTYLEIAAPAHGLGSCWAGYFNAAALFWPPLQEALALPQGHAPFGAMMIGYPKHEYHRIPLRNEADVTWR
jgi:nitroreductase/NAD-dependent dihydropyrimidine dehydrogenase PreA subunit